MTEVPKISYGQSAEIADIIEAANEILTDVLIDGAEKGKDSFSAEGPDFHILRAEAHLVQRRLGDKSEPHLEHAATRLIMAAVLERRNAAKKKAPEPPENLNTMKV